MHESANCRVKNTKYFAAIAKFPSLHQIFKWTILVKTIYIVHEGAIWLFVVVMLHIPMALLLCTTNALKQLSSKYSAPRNRHRKNEERKKEREKWWLLVFIFLMSTVSITYTRRAIFMLFCSFVPFVCLLPHFSYLIAVAHQQGCLRALLVWFASILPFYRNNDVGEKFCRLSERYEVKQLFFS